ncbi:L-threonylcarbamoyladenylate synthase [Foetidibacter luteolus]|uniref:L-threonylcarbamoyladenylate synthase n=1 Tax=Foetidibacter luteolus TaxID=2608880 RepID=UPI00129A1933|nr:L-threonylcarbamoyladenylate synthase [Foetidibacter luteolus]
MIDFQIDIENCINVLRAGGIILYPTDTVWGLGCDATNAEAVEKIIVLKKRPAEKSFVVLVASERDVLQYTAAPDPAIFDYLQSQEKPTTVIYDHAIGLAENVVAADGSVAIRITKDEFCRHLVKRLRKPLVSTSANFSGITPPAIYAQVDKEIVAGVDYVPRYRQDDTRQSPPSSIIRWKKGEVVKIR